MNVVMLVHKRTPPREGGIEIVVEELVSKLVAAGQRVICLICGSALDAVK